MAFSINEFSSYIGKKGLASPNKFKIDITFPNSALSARYGLPISSNDLNLMCESASLAGKTIQSVMNLEYGIRREVAYNGPSNSTLALGFICSSNYQEKIYFDRWIQMIADPEGSSDVAYYDDYAKTSKIKVTTLDRDNVTEKYVVEYLEVYPKTVNTIEMNHTTQNAIAKFTVDFSYAYFRISDQNSISVPPSSLRGR